MSDQELFKACMSRFPTGVAVITTAFEGKKYGITVSSFCSVSLRPQLVSYCLGKDAKRFNIFSAAKDFVINILDETAAKTSILFSKGDMQKWEGEFSTGLELKRSLCHIYCHPKFRYEAGDHEIIVAAVKGKKLSVSNHPPLVYYGSSYHSIK